MTAPMAGFGPMAWSPFPYGAPASSGVPSGMFVDLFNAQTVVGLKTWTVPHVDGSAETVAAWRLDEDVTSMLQLVNASVTNVIFAPRLMATVSGSAAAFTLTGAKTTDSGSTNACIILQGQTAAGAAVTVSDLVAIRNLSTAVLRVTAAGGILLTGGTTPSITVGASGTAITQMRVYSQALDPASVAALTTAEQTFTVTGLTTGDKVFVNKPTNTAGLGIVNVRVSAADTLAITFMNCTAAAIDAASETYTITAIRS